ncbi:MAG: hypothetical protein IPH44_15935 [Myxococcales bacterium]|nr:hypothetical protein [Myxococcales bacterium]MBK7195673.1 hypothetical protein [Myxococcales bacterium]MBP6848351.1 hypothetical protein [Kofleriaceae bacterium]
MLAEIGTMQVRSRSATRVVIAMGWSTAVIGWAVLAIALSAAFALAPTSRWLAGVACAVAFAAWLVATARHRLEFDRDDGVLRIERRIAGLGTRAVVPLFHLRAVVVRRKRHGDGFVAALERRNGEPIVIDSGERAAPLYELVRTIADVTDLRLVYDTTAAS